MSDEIEHSPTPFHIEPKARGNLLHTTDLVKVITRPGEDPRDTVIRVRGYVTRGYLWPVGKDQDDRRGALLFDAASALTAAALVAAADAGLSGKEQFERLAYGLQVWRGDPGEGAPRSPAGYVFQTYQNTPTAHGFGIELHTSRHVETGRLSYVAAVRHGAHGYIGEGVVTIPADHIPVATLMIPLDSLLPVILSNLMKRKML